MKRLLRRVYTLPIFIALGRPLFAISRVPWLEPIALRLARTFAALVQWTYGRKAFTSAPELAEEWNRLMPKPRSAFPVIETDGDTAYVEIRIHCPLRGTGNSEACWRSMEFDRALIRNSGGRLVVLESQSVTGRDRCRLAIRPAGQDLSDLPAAHPRWHKD